MAENEISDYLETDNDNTDIAGISVQENVMRPPAVNNAFRALQGALKRWFKSSLFRLRDSTDQTKLLAFGLSGITPATTRTLTVPDKNGTIALDGDVAWDLIGAEVDLTGLGAHYFALPAGYKDFRFSIFGMQPTTNTDLGARVSFDGGATYPAGPSDYHYGRLVTRDGVAPFHDYGNALNMFFSYAMQANNSQFNGRFDVFPGNAGTYPHVSGRARHYSALGSWVVLHADGHFEGVGRATNMVIFPGSGTFFNGKFQLMGRK